MKNIHSINYLVRTALTSFQESVVGSLGSVSNDGSVLSMDGY